MYTREQIENAIKSKGYAWFENGDYNVNVVSVRTVFFKNGVRDNTITNKFDDFITISYKVNGQWKFYCWEGTTDPGITYMRRVVHPHGTAILVPNQYRGTHMIRKHNGLYDALCQKPDATLKVYRDKNQDNKFDMDDNKIFYDAKGINWHKAGLLSNIINNWSAGCNVFRSSSDFNTFMEILYKSRNLYGNSFSVTLLESTDIKKK